MKYFKNISSMEELRKEYKKLSKMYHPDNNNGSDAEFKAMNAEYEQILKALESGEKVNNVSYDEDAAIREMIDRIVNMNVTIEIVGSWIWVSGNTYAYKEELKAAGFKWCSNKKKWAWHFGEWKAAKSKKSYEQIKAKYGYTTIKEEKESKRLEA